MKMVKPVMIGVAAIPVILAVLVVIPMLTMEEIPTSAINPNDNLYIEFTNMICELYHLESRRNRWQT